MKKLYISIFALSLSISAFAQISNNVTNSMSSAKEFNELVVSDIQIFNPIINNSSSSMNIIWESDFTDPNLWTIDNSGQNGGAYGWSIDAAADGWWSSNGITSTSGGNFAELSNGSTVNPGQVGGVIYTMTTAQSINIFDSIGSVNATLSFEEFGARFYDLQEVQVSMDGTNFVTVGDNLSYSQLTSNGGSQYANPTLREINLAPYLSGTPTSVWIRFSWTSALNLALTDVNYLNTWLTYGWYIDDVKLVESPSNRVTMEDEVIGGWLIDYINYNGLGLNDIYGLDYSVSPLSQIQNHPYAIEALFRNEGTSAQTVNLTYDVTGTVSYSGYSTPEVLNPGDSIFLGASFSPAVTGQYSIDIWGIADSAGAGITTTLSNIETRDIEVTDYIYGKDLGTMEGSRILGGSNDQNHITSRYEMYADESLIALRAFISNESVVGAAVKAVIYEVDTTAATGTLLLASSSDYYLTPQDRGKWVDIPFDFPVDLYNGYAYELGIAGTLSFTGADSSFIGMSGQSMYNGEHSLFDEFGLNPNGTAVLGDPTWYYMTSCPMVRMNFDPSSVSAISDVKQTIFNTYPNPTNGIFTIKLGEAANYDVTVNNVLGQTVFSTSTNGINTSINLSSFDKGIYTVKLKDENAIYTEKIIFE